MLYDVLAAPAPASPAPRIALCPDLHLHVPDSDIQLVFDAAVAALDAEVVEVAFPEAERIYPAFATLQQAEAAFAHAALFPARADEYGADVRSRLEGAVAITLPEYLAAAATRAEIVSAFARAFETADLILTPIAACAPAKILDQAPDFRERVLTYTVPQDVAGLPACAVPVGFDALGLPVGVQLAGPPGSEGRVLAAAEALYSRVGSPKAGNSSA
jgi:Asp-tRNA(Asn)/Glu-tRNA(Gln) amidotransferase A subunit family amidase